MQILLFKKLLFILPKFLNCLDKEDRYKRATEAKLMFVRDK